MGTESFPWGKERLRPDADPSLHSSAVVNSEYSYTSTSPMGRTACTEPQCLYKGALYLNFTKWIRTSAAQLVSYAQWCSGFSPTLNWVFPYQYHITITLYSLICHPRCEQRINYWRLVHLEMTINPTQQ